MPNRLQLVPRLASARETSPIGGHSSVPILQPNDVIQVGRGRLENVTLRNRDHAVHGSRGNVKTFTGPQVDVLEVGFRTPCRKPHFAGEKVNGLVLPLVILQGERLPCLNMQELAHVLVRVRPDEFVAPRLFDASRSVLQVRLPVGVAAGRPTAPWGRPNGNVRNVPKKVTLTTGKNKVKGCATGTKDALLFSGNGTRL